VQDYHQLSFTSSARRLDAGEQIAGSSGRTLTIAGLFAGIGGIELGLHQAGHRTRVMCEIDPAAQRVLADRFPDVELESDVTRMEVLPEVDIVTAGFPCQDLSQAGRTRGIEGRQSGLVDEVFRLLAPSVSTARWLLLENVPFMLHLDRGRAMEYLIRSLEGLGFAWAYRVVDTRSFGLPHRRRRVILLASRTEDPRQVLLVQDAGEPPDLDWRRFARGFYWTEGRGGLGWAADAVPTLKGGSTIGIPSPPGIWLLNDDIVTPDIRDAERLQGFPHDWTLPAIDQSRVRKGPRWKLVGNAVSVPVSRWVGERLLDPRPYDGTLDTSLPPDSPWPMAAWGSAGIWHRADVSAWPVRVERQHLESFLQFEPSLLSARATAGFLSRMRRSSLNFVSGFEEAVERHLRRMGATDTLAFAAAVA
jgi:DNA (cytosine-5)-methyltransferase 1